MCCYWIWWYRRILLIAPPHRHGHWIWCPLLRRPLVVDRVLILIALVVWRLLRRVWGRRVGNIVPRSRNGWLHVWQDGLVRVHGRVDQRFKQLSAQQSHFSSQHGSRYPALRCHIGCDKARQTLCERHVEDTAAGLLSTEGVEQILISNNDARGCSCTVLSGLFSVFFKRQGSFALALDLDCESCCPSILSTTSLLGAVHTLPDTRMKVHPLSTP